MRASRLLVAAAVAALAAGCGTDYDRTEITAVVGSFTGPTTSSKDTVSTSHIQITEGNILKAHIVVFNDDDEPMPLTLKVTTPGVVEVAAVISPDDYTFTAEYDVVGDPDEYFDKELGAVEEVAKDFARAVTSAILQGF